MFIDIIKNIDFIIVGITSMLMIILTVVVLSSDRHSATNRTFFLLSLSIVTWSLLNYFSFQFHDHKTVLWILRFVMFFSVWFAFFIFRFLYVLPDKKFVFSKIYKFIILPSTIFVSALTLTPYVFQSISEFTLEGEVSRVINGPAIILFGILTIGLNFLGIFYLIKKVFQSKNQAEKRQYELILLGILLTVTLIVIFNFIFPAFLNESRYIALAALFTFPFIAFTSYAILKHGLFNVKVIATELLVFAIWIAVLIEFLMEDTLKDKLFTGAIFVFVIVAGIFLIKSVKKEVAQREEIEQLAGRLKSVNRIMSHDIKNVLGKNKDMFGMLLDGSFGALSDHARGFLERVHDDTKKLIRSVIVILESGQEFKLKPAPFDLKEAVLEVVHDTEQDAKAKGLTLTITIDENEAYTVLADRTQLVTHVLRNLVENAIYYTLAGGVTVGLSKKDATVLFSVKDTGIGIPDEDKPNMFKEGNHGKDSIKYNVHSTGYGLYSVKRIVDAHGGKVWFETIPGKGTAFFVELRAFNHLQPLPY